MSGFLSNSTQFLAATPYRRWKTHADFLGMVLLLPSVLPSVETPMASLLPHKQKPPCAGCGSSLTWKAGLLKAKGSGSLGRGLLAHAGWG